jgi:P pilus assembly chaperone PapD
MKRFAILLLSGFLVGAAASAAQAGVALIGELSRVYELSSGETAQGAVTIQNTGKEPVTVKILPSDFIADESGKNKYIPPGSSPRSNAGWISLSAQSVNIMPGERGHVTYKVVPPPDGKALNGLYWSVLLVEPAEFAAIEKDEKTGIAIRTQIRYAVKILTQVNSPGKADLAFSDRQLQHTDKGYVLTLKAENKGERLLNPTVTAELFGAAGQKLGLFKTATQRILPGFTATYEFQFGKLAGGDYRALIIADNGDDAVFAGDYALQVTAP